MADTLCDEIEAFLRLTLMTPTGFSIRATRDRHFVRRLRKGLPYRSDTAERVRAFMRSYNPADEPPRRRQRAVSTDTRQAAEN